MKIVYWWNKISDLLVDILRILTLLLVCFSVTMIVVSIFKDVDTYKYCVMLAVLMYSNKVLNGG